MSSITDALVTIQSAILAPPSVSASPGRLDLALVNQKALPALHALVSRSCFPEAFKAAWKMEVDWPDFMCSDEEGPEIWQFYLDRLAFALGQLGAWDALSDLPLPEEHLLVARMYLTIGSLGIEDSLVFWTPFLHQIIPDPSFPVASLIYAISAGKLRKDKDCIHIRERLGKYFNLTLHEQETYTQNFFRAERNRRSESGFTPLASLTPEEVDKFDPFEGSE